MNASDDIINLIWDRTAYQVEPLSRYAGMCMSGIVGLSRYRT